jgi:CheY-like chemotaxis protein
MDQKTIVIVEDNALNLELMTDVLEVHGYIVHGITTAEEALTAMPELAADLILMDIALPGMDGLAAVNALKQRPATAGIPIVVVSAHAMESDKEAAAKAGCVGYMTKPIDTRTFPVAVAQHIADAATGQKAA